MVHLSCVKTNTKKPHPFLGGASLISNTSQKCYAQIVVFLQRSIMPYSKSLIKDIRERIQSSSEATFVVADFADLSDRDQILRALRGLIQEELLIRVGYGVYVRAKRSRFSGKLLPETDLRSIAITALRKNGVRILPTKYEQTYNNGESTQVPTGIVIGVDRRVNRKISFNGRTVQYELVTA